MNQSKANIAPPDIPIESISDKSDKDPSAPLKSQIDRQNENIKSNKRLIDFTFALMVGVVIVSFIGFVTFLIDAWLYRTQAYKEYTQTINENKDLIDSYYSDNEQIKSELFEIKQLMKDSNEQSEKN